MAWKTAGASLLCVLLACCGNASHAGSPQDAGAADGAPEHVSCSADASVCTLPPAPGNESPNNSGTTIVMAISKLYLGDTDRWGLPDPQAWKSYGYNLDGLISTGTDENHCSPQPSADPITVKTDGEGGIDNSFGENVLPMLQAMGAGYPLPVQQAIADGRSSVLFRIDNLLDPDHKPDQNGLGGAIYEGTDKGSVAAFDGSDVWLVTYDSVVGGNVDAPKATFESSYVTDGVWVARSSAGFVLPIVTPDYTVRLPIRRAVITMRIHSAGASAASAADGVIAGVVDPDSIVTWGRTLATAHDKSSCSGANFDSTAQALRATADIMSDATNGDPGVTCDAISIGIGFEATAAKLGAVAPQAAPAPDPCAP